MPIQQLYLATPPKAEPDPIPEEEETKTEVVTQVSSGVKRILRMANERDVVDPEEKFMKKEIGHISDETLEKMYSTRMTDAQKQEL